MSKTTRHLEKLGRVASSKCPALARYFYYKCLKSTGSSEYEQQIENNTLFSLCWYCGNQLQTDQCSIKVVPKPALTKQIKRQIKRIGYNQQNIGRYQKSIVQSYINSPNKLVIVCNLCKKSRHVKCQSRLERQKQKEVCKQERDRLLQLQLPVESVKTRKDRKKERKKQSRQRKLDGLEDDVNAGLLLSTSDKTGGDRSRDCNSAEEKSTSTECAMNVESHITAVNEARTVSVEDNITVENEHSDQCTPDVKQEISTSRCTNIKQGTPSNNSSRKSKPNIKQEAPNIKQGQPSSSFTNLMDIAGKTKLSNMDKVRKLPTVESDKQLYSTQKSASAKKQKAKKMSQQLGRILKQEQTKSSSGSLTDFLSSL